MSTFRTTVYPELTVKSLSRRVQFHNGEAEATGETAAWLAEFARTHPEYGIEQVDEDKPLTPKQKAKARAADLGLDTSGTVAEIEARIADHEAAQDDPEDDADADDADDEDADEDEDQPEDEDA